MLRSMRLCTLVMLLFCVAEPAFAQDDLDDDPGHASVALLVGYGVELSDNLIDPFGFGLGIRGGYTFDPGIYVGGHFNYFLGDTATFGVTEVTLRAATLGLEAGYDLLLEPLILRPSIGVGAAFFSSSGESEDDEGSESDTQLYIAPGLSLLYPFDQWFAGVDARFFIRPDDETRTAFATMATFGIRF